MTAATITVQQVWPWWLWLHSSTSLASTATITWFNKSGLDGYDYGSTSLASMATITVQQVWPRWLQLWFNKSGLDGYNYGSTSLASMATIMWFNKFGLDSYNYAVTRGSTIWCLTVSMMGNRYDFNAGNNEQKGSGEWWWVCNCVGI